MNVRIILMNDPTKTVRMKKPSSAKVFEMSSTLRTAPAIMKQTPMGVNLKGEREAFALGDTAFFDLN